MSSPNSQDSSQARMSNEQLLEFGRRKQTLLEAQSRLESLLLAPAPTLAAEVRHERQRTEASDFNVLIIGEFSRGKSTLLNALLLADMPPDRLPAHGILPMHVTPTTAVITRIQYGDTPKMVLYPKRIHQEGAADIQPPPIIVSVDEIERHTAVNPDLEDAPPSPYEQADVYWPLNLLRANVRLVDTPGLNAMEEHEQVTTNYFKESDAILFVTRCSVAGEISEMATLSELRTLGRDDIMFVCNGINEIAESERERIRRYCLTTFGEWVKDSKNQILFVDARSALEGRLRGDEATAERSGVPNVERLLKHFLATERGRVKIVYPVRKLKSVVLAASHQLSDMNRQLLTSEETLRQRWQEKQDDFRQLNERMSQIQKVIAATRMDVRSLVQAKASVLFTEIARQIPGWAAEYRQNTKLHVFSNLIGKDKKQKAIQEIQDHLQTRVNEELTRWREADLVPMVAERTERLFADLERRVQEFEQELAETRAYLATGSFSTGGVQVNASLPGEVALWQRITSAVAGAVLIDPGLVLAGGGAGWGGFGKQLAISLGVGAVAFFTGTIWVYLCGTVAIAIFNLFRRGQNMNDALKTLVATQFVSELQARNVEYSAKVATSVDDELQKIEQAIAGELSRALATAREATEQALRAKAQGEEEVARQRYQNETTQRDLQNIDKAMQSLLEAYALNE